ncbi:hypothetical protein [Leptolyngbya sp. NIES-2104]|uniref:hypothetical protein n=1 Tax=Leptolyngbya sp. NIES-2104 TaxID=1552121 RepID=UPI0006EC78C3|nr:hypothetical protein [Leptolyngbya sp. NIES-2104]GAP97320.1 hypothetical protein NIES2104_38670 [Leptolyngbya sp. NIES-2104]
MSKRFTKRITGRISRGTLVVCAGALTFWMSGCTVGEETVVTEATPSPKANSSTPAQSFAKPTVPAKDAPKGKTSNKIAGLLQSTNPEERARQVQRGITSGKDPFSSVPPLVSFKVPVVNREGAPGGAQPPEATQPQSQNRPEPRTTPKPEPKSPIKSLPPLPDPTLAKAVQVTGVIVVGGVPQAIVQAPNESTSRYVQVGQRISNGQVLVKRIEMNGGSDPIVILEQNGVEVARAVGSPASPAAPGKSA